ncbi:MAG: hypothetical protein A2Y17_08645 [Clostridiales bacterium GWF2_38_85]|nr:MAG: hypothetical protein A2Y17_08645 [Clostridiales bacterium GWF2_38_85]HBL83737.1 hypothetical protein [Clostridiales bacterium]
MKKLFILLLVAGLLLSSCDSADTSSKDMVSDTSDTSAESSVVSETESSPAVIEKDYPHVIGTFIQPYLFADSTQQIWENHFDGLLEAGIDIVIIQWAAETPYSKFKSVYYPSTLANSNKSNEGYSYHPYCIERCLAAAEKKGIKVFIGLNLSDEWWDKAATDRDWYMSQGDIGNQMANEIYDLYKEKYPNALYGWYYAWELYNVMGRYESQVAEFLNVNLDYLTELDATMPLMLSPFVSKSGSTAVQAGEQWTKVFAEANFRDGDIYCCQDSVGAGHISIDMLDAYYSELKKACDTEEGLVFWANNEDFDQSDWSSATIGRFVEQMNISEKYVEEHVTFAYSHYYSPDTGHAKFHDAYLQYYNTGVVENYDIPTPTVTYTVSGNNVTFKITAENSPVGLFKLYITRTGLNRKVVSLLEYNGSTITINETDSLDGLNANADALYSIYVVDINGNKSETAKVTIER